MSWKLCVTKTDLMKWNIVGDAFLNKECIKSISEELNLIERKSDTRYYAYLDFGVPKIVFCIIYKGTLDMFKISQVAVVNSSYMLILHTKLRDLMVEMGKNFYMPTFFKTHKTVQSEFVNGYADNYINYIWESLGVDIVTNGDRTEFRIGD